MSEKDRLSKMAPQGVFVPVPDKKEEKTEKEASAFEKALDRAERKLQNGESLIHKPHHN